MKLYTRKRLISVIILAIIIILIFFAFNKKVKVEYVTAIVKRDKIIQTVSEVGMVKAAKEINLSFLQAGKISVIPVSIGDEVKKDEILAELDYSTLAIKKQEAVANLEIAKANLSKLLVGATAHEIAVSQANVDQAKSAYEAAQTDYEKVKNIAAENEIQAKKTLADLESDSFDNVTTYEQAVKTAQINLDNAKRTYQQAINNKRDALLTAVENKLSVSNTALDNIKTILNDSEARSNLSIKNPSYLTKTEDAYAKAQILMATANASLATVKVSYQDSDLEIASVDSLTALNKVFESLNYCYYALENSTVSQSFTQAELDAYKTNISTQLTNASAGITAIETAKQNWNDAALTYKTEISSLEGILTNAQVSLSDAILTAKNNLASVKLSGEQQITTAQSKIDNSYKSWEVANAQLEKLKSPPRIEDISLTQAQVKQADASLNLVEKQIEESIIKAPIDGTIIKIDYEAGEQISAAKPVLAMLGENNFEIEVDISEADIAKVKSDDSAVITLDAFGEDKKFAGQVYFIEPAETVIQDVIYYKIKISFVEDKSKLIGVKPGMTANVIITTAEKSGILIIPTRAMIERNGGSKLVRVLVAGEVSEVPISAGLRGDEGMMEVISGVKEGDEVVVYTKEGN